MRKTLTTLLALALLGWLLPTFAVAAGSITAKSMIAGIGGVVTFNGFEANAAATVSVTSPTGDQFSLPETFDGRGNGSVALPGERMLKSGNYTLNVIFGSNIAATSKLEVLPDSVDPAGSSVSADKKSFAPDGVDHVTVTVLLQDKFGNPLSTRPVQFIPSRNDATVRMQANVTDAQGKIAASILSKQAGPVTVRVFDLLSAQTLDATVTLLAGDPSLAYAVGGYQDNGTYVGPGVQPGQTTYPQYPPAPYAPYPYYNPYAVSPYNANLFYDPAYAQSMQASLVASFKVELNDSHPQTNNALNLTVTAIDRQGNPVESYVGSVAVFSPTDPTATMPGSGLTDSGEGKLTFQPRDLGQVRAPLSVVFRRGGNQTLRVEDRSGSQPVSGELTITVTGPDVIPEANRINVTYPLKNGFVRGLSFNVEGTGPKFSNLRIKIVGGAQDTFFGESDADGHFSIPVQLKDGLTQFTLRVTSDPNGVYDSGDVVFGIKANPPQIQSIDFSPAQENENVLVTVVTEPGDTVSMKLLTQDLSLVETTGKPGTYQAGFTAPATGNYQPVFTVTDAAGNAVQQRGNLKVSPKGLPTVTGLTAESRPSSVYLSWQPVTGAASYRVYVGTSPSDLLAIDTKSPTTTALIKDLDAATLYYFSLTAVNGESESAEQSGVVTAMPLGMKMKVTPGDASLHLQWELPGDLNLSAFVLEYGVDPKKLGERRMFNGELRDTVLRDLLPGVTYYLRLTPVTVEGNALTDLSSLTQGTVLTFAGFHAVAGENPSFDPNALPPPDLHSGAPSVTGVTGLPKSGLLAALAAAAFGTLLFTQRRRRVQTAHFLAAMDRNYHV